MAQAALGLCTLGKNPLQKLKVFRIPRNGECLHAGAYNATQDWEELAEEYSQLYPVEVTQALLNGSFHDPDFDVSSLLPSGVSFTDPEFFNDMGSNVSSTLQVSGCLMMSPASRVLYSMCSLLSMKDKYHTSYGYLWIHSDNHCYLP